MTVTVVDFCLALTQVVELEMDHQRLGRIQNIEKLVNLRKASFCDNELLRIEVSFSFTPPGTFPLALTHNRASFLLLFLSGVQGLQHALHLEELSLEENKISTLENLAHLTCLVRPLTKLQNCKIPASIIDYSPFPVWLD